ncbi:MAG: hypothetical protein Q9219_000886 [cf. Caloplaca sp. 3 TL-2023]
MDDGAGLSVGTYTSENQEGCHNIFGPYQMHILIQPPREARPGDILYPPLTIGLRALEGRQEDEDSAEDPNSYWAAVSVVSEDGLIALAPPSTTLIAGTIVDSIHQAEPQGEEVGLGYFVFTNIKINQTGNFRLRVSLLRMSTPGSSASDANGCNPSVPAVTNTGSLTTRVLHVHEGALARSIGQSPSR